MDSTPLHMLAQGVHLDRHRQHSDLWVWVIQQLLRARPRTANGQMQNETWVNLHHYPAALALKAASLAAVAAGRDDVLLRLLTEPTWREEFSGQQERPAWDILHDYRTVDPQVINAFPRWGSTAGWHYPQSHLFKAELRPVLLPILGDGIAYEQLYSRTVYRTAIVQHQCDTGRFRAAPGEFIGEWQWDGDVLKWETDFRATADPAVWGLTPEARTEDDDLTALAAELGRSRRYG